jgi:hypothetical protein
MKNHKTGRLRPICIKVYVTEEEGRKIVKRAQKSNMDTSRFLRTLGLTGKIILPTPVTDRETLLSLASIGNNINQISYALNRAEANILNRKVRNKLQRSISELKDILMQTGTKLYSRIQKEIDLAKKEK